MKMEEDELKEELEEIAKEYMAENIKDILDGKINEEEYTKEVSKRFMNKKLKEVVEDKENEGLADTLKYGMKMVELLGNKRFERLNSKVAEINKRITDGVEKWEEEDSIIVYSYLKQGVELIEEINKKYNL